MTKYFGKICEKHPDLFGERYLSRRGCTACCNAKSKAIHKRKRQTDPMYRFFDNLYFSEYAANKRKIDKEYRDRKINIANERRLLKESRIPVWADTDKIREIYKKARDAGMTVDHIIPLKGKLVSGLHVHNNLQLLPSGDNSSKGNKFEIE